MNEKTYIDEWGGLVGYCTTCLAEQELGQACQECDGGEVVPYDDDDPADGTA